MNTNIRLPFMAVLLSLTGVAIVGCSQSNRQVATPTQAPQPAQVQLTAAPAQTFNPTVTPPPQPVQGYVFNPEPAPVPVQTAVVKRHRHRYLHIVMRDHRCFLADNYGDYYATGRDNDGDVYPIYEDPGTGADYPLYYDQDRDEYYRCVENNDGDYYRNYCGDPDDEFYQGDPDQQEECESDQCQPFVINFDINYSNYQGYDPDYGGYHGPRYSRHNHDFVSVLPVIVAAFIVIENSNDNDSYHQGGSVYVGRHAYRAPAVMVKTANNVSARFTAIPGPPVGHFRGFVGAVSDRSNHRTPAMIAGNSVRKREPSRTEVAASTAVAVHEAARTVAGKREGVGRITVAPMRKARPDTGGSHARTAYMPGHHQPMTGQKVVALSKRRSVTKVRTAQAQPTARNRMLITTKVSQRTKTVVRKKVATASRPVSAGRQAEQSSLRRSITIVQKVRSAPVRERVVAQRPRVLPQPERHQQASTPVRRGPTSTPRPVARVEQNRMQSPPQRQRIAFAPAEEHRQAVPQRPRPSGGRPQQRPAPSNRRDDNPNKNK